MRRHRSSFNYLVLPLICCLLTACTAAVPSQTEQLSSGKTVVIRILEPRDALTLIRQRQNDTGFVILDVRTPEEFETGHIEGAINVNYHADTFTSDLDRLDKNKTYLVYCRTGRRSSDTVSIMVRLGFTGIYRVEGDIVKWKALGLPLTKPAR